MSNYPENWLRSICFLRAADCDDSETYQRALRLCKSARAELSIVSVQDDLPEGLVRFLASWGARAEDLTSEAEQSGKIERMLEDARRCGVNASSEVLRGRKVLEVSRKILRDKHDLLIKAAEPAHAFQRILLGHTDRQLIRQSPCTVWIEKPSHGKAHDRILAAVDPAPFEDDVAGDSPRHELNASILRFGRLLSQVEQEELHIVHAWSFDFEMPLQSRAGFTDKEVERVSESFRKSHELALGELLAPYRQFISRVHLVKGQAGEEIARLAASESIDVVVMGTVCRTGLGALLIGNTAETVLDQARCSIVALKPPGFVSPVCL